MCAPTASEAHTGEDPEFSLQHTKFAVLCRTPRCLFFSFRFHAQAIWVGLADFSHTQAWVSDKHNVVVAFGCRHITTLDFEGPNNPFLVFTNFAIYEVERDHCITLLNRVSTVDSKN